MYIHIVYLYMYVLYISLCGGKHLDLLTPKKGSTKAKNELRKRKKIIEARFDTVLQV